MTTQFPKTHYAGPHNEAIEQADGTHRILYNGFEVATLSYCEGYQWAQLYAAAPELLAACQLRIDEWHANSKNFNKKEPESLKLMRDAIAKLDH